MMSLAPWRALLLALHDKQACMLQPCPYDGTPWVVYARAPCSKWHQDWHVERGWGLFWRLAQVQGLYRHATVGRTPSRRMDRIPSWINLSTMGALFSVV
jgi:hypothetical protein